MNVAGLILVIIATASWTVGDFSIQQGTRKFGDWFTLFLIGIVGLVFLSPFVLSDIGEVVQSGKTLFLLILCSVVSLATALLLFEALKRGKLSIIEPIFALELIAAVASSALAGERLFAASYYLIALIFIGLFFTTVKNPATFLKKGIFFEKGIMYAVIGALLMGFTDFLTGHASREASPLITIWFVHSFLAVTCFAYLFAKGEFFVKFSLVRKNLWMSMRLAVADNVGWLAYAGSMVLVPISIATAITQSYIAFAVMAGIFLNKEKIRFHQLAGIALTVASAILLIF